MGIVPADDPRPGTAQVVLLASVMLAGGSPDAKRPLPTVRKGPINVVCVTVT